MPSTTETSINQRIIEVYRELRSRSRVKSKSEFARIAGFQNTHWTEYEKEIRRFTPTHINNLVNHFRDLSREFIETGEGKIFFPPVAPDAGLITFLNDLPSVELPFVSVHARASYIGLGGAQVDPRNFDTVSLALMTPEEAERYKGAVVFEVNGDSMEPLLHSGNRVIAWPVDEGKWEQIHNKVCVVAYDDTVTIKAIRANDLFTKKHLVLHALNERAGYLPVGQSSIRSIWRVEEFFDRPKVRL